MAVVIGAIIAVGEGLATSRFGLQHAFLLSMPRYGCIMSCAWQGIADTR